MTNNFGQKNFTQLVLLIDSLKLNLSTLIIFLAPVQQLLSPFHSVIINLQSWPLDLTYIL